MNELANLYLDFNKNRERLTGHMKRLKRVFGDRLLPECPEGQDPLDDFISLVFPEGMGQAYCLCNTAPRPGTFYLTIRPSIAGPRLDEAFPPGIVLCIHGNPWPPIAPNPVLVVNGIVDVARSSAKAFEQEKTVIPYTQEGNVHPARNRRQNLLVPDFLAKLPAISQLTHQKLQDWRGYMGWKQRVIESGLAGLRYLSVELTDDGQLRFLIAAESEEAFKQSFKRIRSGEMRAFGLRHSKHAWLFQYNEKSRGPYVDVGDFRRYEPLASPSQPPDDGMPWKDPFIAYMYFDPDEDRPIDVEEFDGNGNGQSVNKGILSLFPKTGFLALCALGDMALIRRQLGALERLERQGGYAPYLSSYLFDIRAAHRPEQLVEVDEWFFDELNDDQKTAVRKMLSAQDVFLAQGPPGTGKTTLIAEAAAQFARLGKKVLIASQANLATNNALERLPKTSLIRAVRLGRKEKIGDDMLFSQDNALGQYYGAVARSCRERFLELWAQAEQRIRDREKWIERSDILHADITGFEERLSALRSRRTELREERAAEEGRLEAIRDRHREQEHLERFRRLLDGQEDGEFLLPDGLLNLFYDRVVVALDTLTEAFIVMNPYWRVREGDSPGVRSGFVRDILHRWRAMQTDMPHLEADLARLREMGGERILDPQTAADLDRLRSEIARVQEAMVDDEALFERYQDLKRREREIKRQAPGLDRALYERVFNGTKDGRLYHLTLTHSETSRSQAVKTLERALSLIEEVRSPVDEGLAAVRRDLSDRMETCAGEEADNRNLRRLDGGLRHHEAKRTEIAEQLADRQRALQEQIDGRLREEGFDGARTVEDYADLRDRLRAAIDNDREAVAKQDEFRRLWEPVLEDWVSDLEDRDSAAHDRNYLLDTYVANCNVVGVTCNENPQVLERAGHSNFDVVIIDEVSKATPPELLMPMMLGRTAILVGDHRQLPPLFKEREGSWEEAVNDREEEGDEATELTRENFERYQKLVTASLFKEHFEKADDAIKASLFTQFRMHPQIMRVVNHFYEYRLECGLPDPDGEQSNSDPRGHRMHNMTLTGPDERAYVTPERHALWIDTSRDPSGRPHFERQSGTSKVNDLEATLIAKALADIDAECARLGYGGANRKQVGVISFYGRQVRRIREAIQRLQRKRGRKFEAIQYDVNTVDRFQGREAPIILVSMVRNRKHTHTSSRAFVAQFERINVAFSRAQELLLIFGASQMFYQYPIVMPNLDQPGTTTRRVYQAIIDDLRREGRFWDSGRLMAQEDYRDTLPQSARNKTRR